MNDRYARPSFGQMSRARPVAAGLLIALASAAPAAAQEKIRVVATLPTYAAIAREVTGDRADVTAIARGDEDPHFVDPRPSYAAAVARADLFITTGLDLELWVPAVIDRARNAEVVEGAPGHVVAYSGIKLLDVPVAVSRTGGDVHVFGNPHIHTDPVNGIVIARNVLEGLRRVDPSHADIYEANTARFEGRVLERLFGPRLLEILGREPLFDLARSHRFWSFAAERSYRGRPLVDYLGGWLAMGERFRGGRMACYHKNWAYFSARFRIECAIYVEPKPGIPPTPGHVRDVIEFMRSERIPVLLAANYFSRTQVERVASRTGARAVIVPEHVAGAEGVDTYFDLIDLWVSRLATAFEQQDGRAESGSPGGVPSGAPARP